MMTKDLNKVVASEGLNGYHANGNTVRGQFWSSWVHKARVDMDRAGIASWDSGRVPMSRHYTNPDND